MASSSSDTSSDNMEACKLEIQSVLNSKKCGKCELQTVTTYCEQCQEFICDECKNLHKKWKGMRTHTTHSVEIGDDALFRNATLATQEKALLIFSRIKQHLAATEKALKSFDEKNKEIKMKQHDVEATISEKCDRLITVVNERKASLVECLERDTQVVMTKVEEERKRVLAVQNLLKSSLHSASTASGCSSIEDRDKLMKHASDGVDQATEMLGSMSLPPTLKPCMSLTDIDEVFEACSSFGRISNVALCAENSLASGDGLKFARVDESIAVTVHPKDNEGEEYDKQVVVTADLKHCSTQTSALCTIETQSKSQYSVTYKPTRLGKHALEICINGTHIRGSPFAISVHATANFFTSTDQCHHGQNTIAELKQPTGITTDNEGNIIVVERGANCLSVYSAEYRKVTSFGSKGITDGLLSSPYGVAIDDDNNIYVTDSGNHRIQKYTSNGQFIAKVGTKGSEYMRFNNPMGIAYNPKDGKLYVCDSTNCRIVVLNTDLSWQDSFGTKGDKEMEFKYPGNIAIDSKGMIYVSEYNTNYRIQVFSSENQHIKMIDAKNSTLGKLQNPHGIAFDSGNTMYVVEIGIAALGKWSATLCLFDSSQEPLGRFVPSRGFKEPNAVHMDRNDKLYIADTGNGRVQIFQ